MKRIKRHNWNEYRAFVLKVSIREYEFLKWVCEGKKGRDKLQGYSCENIYDLSSYLSQGDCLEFFKMAASLKKFNTWVENKKPYLQNLCSGLRTTENELRKLLEKKEREVPPVDVNTV